MFPLPSQIWSSHSIAWPHNTNSFDNGITHPILIIISFQSLPQHCF